MGVITGWVLALIQKLRLRRRGLRSLGPWSRTIASLRGSGIPRRRPARPIASGRGSRIPRRRPAVSSWEGSGKGAREWWKRIRIGESPGVSPPIWETPPARAKPDEDAATAPTTEPIVETATEAVMEAPTTAPTRATPTSATMKATAAPTTTTAAPTTATAMKATATAAVLGESGGREAEHRQETGCHQYSKPCHGSHSNEGILTYLIDGHDWPGLPRGDCGGA